jgi:hypothetical protein
LVKAYQQLSQYLEETILRQNEKLEDKSLLVLDNGYFRGFLVAKVDSKQISLQIDLSPLINSHLKNGDIHNTDMKPILEIYIVGLQYLLELSKKQFTIKFIREEGIWFAKKVLNKEPDEELCKLITLSDKHRLRPFQND